MGIHTSRKLRQIKNQIWKIEMANISDWTEITVVGNQQ